MVRVTGVHFVFCLFVGRLCAVFDGRCNMATGAGEQRRMVLPLGSSSRDVVEEDFSLGVATIQQRQSQQQSLGLLSAAANTSAFTCVEA